MPKVVSIKLEPVEWSYGDFEVTLRHDTETATNWTGPNDEGRLEPPAIEDVPKVLADIAPDDHGKIAAAIDDNTWPAADRLKAVTYWWHYMQGRHDAMSHWLRVMEQAQELGKKIGEQKAAALVRDAENNIKGQDNQAPLDDA